MVIMAIMLWLYTAKNKIDIGVYAKNRKLTAVLKKKIICSKVLAKKTTLKFFFVLCIWPDISKKMAILEALAIKHVHARLQLVHLHLCCAPIFMKFETLPNTT